MKIFYLVLLYKWVEVGDFRKFHDVTLAADRFDRTTKNAPVQSSVVALNFIKVKEWFGWWGIPLPNTL